MRRFAVLNIVDYNNKRVTFTLLVVFLFCLIMPPPRRGGGGIRRSSASVVRPSVCLMSRTSALTRKPKGPGRRRGTPGHMRLPHRLQGQKVKSQGGAGAYCGGDLAAQLVI